MSRPSLKKIFGVGPLGGLISVGLLFIALGIDRYTGSPVCRSFSGWQSTAGRS